jgi:hypothetical protein
MRCDSSDSDNSNSPRERPRCSRFASRPAAKQSEPRARARPRAKQAATGPHTTEAPQCTTAPVWVNPFAPRLLDFRFILVPLYGNNSQESVSPRPAARHSDGDQETLSPLAPPRGEGPGVRGNEAQPGKLTKPEGIILPLAKQPGEGVPGSIRDSNWQPSLHWNITSRCCEPGHRVTVAIVASRRPSR